MRKSRKKVGSFFANRKKVGIFYLYLHKQLYKIMATIKFRLSSKADKSTGQSEILVRFFHGRIDQSGKTNIFILPKYWNAANERVTVPKARVMSPEAKALAEQLAAANARLAEVRKVIGVAFNEAGAGKVELPSKWLVNLLREYNFPKAEQSRRVVDCLERWNNERAVSASNTAHGRAVIRAFRRFLIYSGMEGAQVDEITEETLRDFVEYLREEYSFYEVEADKNGGRRIIFLDSRFKAAFQAVPESRLPAQRGQNAINKFLDCLRTFFLWAQEKEEITSKNPFRKFSIPPYQYGTPYYITVEERNQLAACELSGRLAEQRDIFVFQCVVGCRVSDLRNLTKNSIINGVLEYIPRKTKEGKPRTVRVPLNAVALEILERYKDIPGDKLLPCISDQNYNYAIKEIFTAAGLNRYVTILNPTTREEEKRRLNEIASSHLARRCFIGNMYKRVQDPNLIGKLSGHVEGSRAFNRYRDIDEEMARSLVDMIV